MGINFYENEDFWLDFLFGFKHLDDISIFAYAFIPIDLFLEELFRLSMSNYYKFVLGFTLTYLSSSWKFFYVMSINKSLNWSMEHNNKISSPNYMIFKKVIN